uniref:Uncharacterized protein n=1 Tax=Mola mola TaxID=94237 RepID=A0A3Q3VUH6_MOLML
ANIQNLGTEPMTLGSPTSPKPTSGAQFLPGFLMGDLPAPTTPQPRAFNLATPIAENTAGGDSAPQPVIPTPKDKSGAPPVRSIHDDLITVATPINTHRQVRPSACSMHLTIQTETLVLAAGLLQSLEGFDYLHPQESGGSC